MSGGLSFDLCRAPGCDVSRLPLWTTECVLLRGGGDRKDAVYRVTYTVGNTRQDAASS